MYCQKCGTQNQEGQRFCTSCGAPLPAGNFPVYQKEPGMDGNYNVSGSIPVWDSPAVGAVKNIGASPLFLAGTILYSVYLLLSLISSVQGSAGVLSLLNRIAEQMGGNYYMPQHAMSGIVGGASVIGALIGMLPSVIIAVGIWLVFVSAKKVQNAGMSTAGLTMIKVIYMIEIVIYSILIVICLIGSAVVFVKSSNSYYQSGGTAIGAFILFVAVILGIIDFYNVKVVQSVNAVKDTIITQRASDKVSAFVGVIAFISGGITVISSFFTFSGMGFLTNVCSAAANIIFGVILFRYRNYMNLIKSGRAIPERSVSQRTTVRQQPVNGGQPTYQQQSGNGSHAGYQQQPAGGQPSAYGRQPVNPESETMVLTPEMTGEETMVLSAPKKPQIYGYLVRSKTNETAALTKERFVIGKSADADFCVSDNPAVSRKHAEIVCRNGAFFLVDKGSTNHVYVNGNMIQSEMEIPVEEGTVFCCANEDFLIRKDIE